MERACWLSRAHFFRAKLASAIVFGMLAWPEGTPAQVLLPPYVYAFRRPLVEPDLYISPKRVAAILAREGYRLAGPLGRRGDQIVAVGVNAEGWRMRFIVDPYEGEVLSSRPLGPVFEYGGSREVGAPAQHYEPADPIEPGEYGSHSGRTFRDPYEPMDPNERGRNEPWRVPHVGGEILPPPPKAFSPRAKPAISAADSSHRAALHPSLAPKRKTSPAPAVAAPSPPASAPTAQSNAPPKVTALPSASPAPETQSNTTLSSPNAPAQATNTAPQAVKLPTASRAVSVPARASSTESSSSSALPPSSVEKSNVKATNEASPKTNISR